MSWCESVRQTRHNRNVADDDLRSVRIEVEGASDPVLKVPELTAPGRGSSRWPIILLVVLVGLLGLALVALAPNEDEAADGTQRNETPTTLPADPDADSIEQGGLDAGVASDQQSDSVSGFRVVAPVIPVEAETPAFLGQVIATSDGFVASASNQTFRRPRLLSSTTGLEWDEIETTVTSSSGAELGALSWGELFATSDGFGLMANDSNEDFRTEFASSENAVEWTVQDDLSGEGEPGGVNQVLTVRDDSLVALRLGSQPIERVVRELTNVQIPNVGVCGAFRTPRAERQFQLFSCAGRESALIDANTVKDGFDAELVLDCLASLGGRRIGPAVTFVEIGQDDRTVGSFGPERDDWSPVSVPTPLRSGEIAFVDTGVPNSQVCRQFIQLDAPRAPSLIVLDGELGVRSVAALPVTLDNGTGRRSLSGVEIVGQTAELAEGSTHLLVTIGDELWSFGLVRGEWTLLYDTTNEASRFRVGALTLTINGNRLFQPAVDGLRIIDLGETADGEVSVDVGVAPIEPPDTFSIEGFRLSEMNFASNDRILLTDGLGRRLWSIDVPLPAGERQLEFAEDQGGVGVARVR